MESLISVIVPVYKVEKYLKRCVDSILNQTYKNLEIILVDDGSPDNCPKMCDDYAKLDSRVKVIHKENGGVSSARNVALDTATGDYIGFVDADDYIHPKMYEILLKNAVENNCDCSLCSWSELSNEEYVNLVIDTEKKPEVFTTREAVLREFSFYRDSLGVVVWNKIIKTNIAKKFRFDITMSFGEDTYYTSQIIPECKGVCRIEVPLYDYIQNEGSAINGGLSVWYKENARIKLYRRMAFDIKQTEYKDLFGVAYNYFFDRTIVILRRNDDPKAKKTIRKFIRKEIPALLFSRGISLKMKAAYSMFGFNLMK